MTRRSPRMVRGLRLRFHSNAPRSFSRHALELAGVTLLRGRRPTRRTGDPKISEGVRVEEELVAARAQQVLLAELRERQAHRLAGHADRLGELVVRDAQHHAVLAGLAGGAAAEVQQRADQAAVAVLEHESRRIIARSLELLRQLPA